MRRKASYGVMLAFVLAGCAHRAPAPAGTAQPLMIDDRGVTMPLTDAVTKIDFRPYLPPGEILRFAVIPPLGGADTTANRGIAIEYDAGGSALLISQWPKQRFTLTFGGDDITNRPCQVVHFKTDGVAWTTQHDLLMTLQADGRIPAGRIDAESQRLIAAGACR